MKELSHTLKCQDCNARFKLKMEFSIAGDQKKVISLINSIDIRIRPDTKQWDKTAQKNILDKSLTEVLYNFWRINRIKYMRNAYAIARKSTPQEKLLCNKCYYKEVHTDNLIR